MRLSVRAGVVRGQQAPDFLIAWSARNLRNTGRPRGSAAAPSRRWFRRLRLRIRGRPPANPPGPRPRSCRTSFWRNACTIARMVAPVARPSSTRIVVRPRSSGAGRPSRYLFAPFELSQFAGGDGFGTILKTGFEVVVFHRRRFQQFGREWCIRKKRGRVRRFGYSTVTLLARLRGLSTSRPSSTAR